MTLPNSTSLNIVCANIVESYMILNSKGVSDAVRDYLTDADRSVTFDEFKWMCFIVARDSGHMKPTIKDMKDDYSLTPGGQDANG